MRRIIFLAACCALLVGCAQDNTPRSTMRQRQDQAMKDPFGFQPSFNPDSVGGGGTLDFDKNAFRRDVREVVDP
jgi:hypothetical protein